jgi:hypothetical protein
MFDGAETDALSVGKKSDKVVTVLIDNANAERVGEGSNRVREGHVVLKDLDGRRFEEQLSGVYPCLS